MDIIFDIDGTLANAEHRLHYIKDPNYWVGVPPRPDWNTFLSDEQKEKDTAIGPIWRLMDHLTAAFTQDRLGHDRILFITGRSEEQRDMTKFWLVRMAKAYCCRPIIVAQAPLYMRKAQDRRPSHVVKEELLEQARTEGYDPQLVFEDRKDDTAMWRAKGLLCCQVADGDY